MIDDSVQVARLHTSAGRTASAPTREQNHGGNPQLSSPNRQVEGAVAWLAQQEGDASVDAPLEDAALSSVEGAAIEEAGGRFQARACPTKFTTEELYRCWYV